MTHIIDQVEKKLAGGERLTDEDALQLFASPELIEIGRLADQANRAKNQDVVTYNVNRHINPTNICALSCKFCAYSRKPGEEGAYAYSIEEMVKKAGEAVAQGATEVHMVGGLHPRWKFEYYRDMIKAVKDAFPQVHIKAFTAVEFDWLARRARKTIKEVMIELREVGLGSLPGGGAEIFHPEIRDAICDTKVSAEDWLDTHRTAHSLGMNSNCTMLYGHIENYFHRVDHMRRLRELQDETKGFNTFIPLSFQPFQNEMGIDKYTFGYDDLKTLAVARLYLDNFRHVKAYWIMLGQDIAQMALSFGANDLDGTVIEEKISRMAGGRAGMAMDRSTIESMVLKAKRIPCERDTLHRPLGDVPALVAKAAERRAAVTVSAALLNKAAYQEPLSVDELVQLATGADLHALGRLALATPEAESRRGSASYSPAVVTALRPGTSAGAICEEVRREIEQSRSRHGLAPFTIALDLGETKMAAAQGGGQHSDEDAPPADLGALLELLFALSHSFTDAEISLWGFKALWRLALESGVDARDLMVRLREAGVDSLESSPHESERDMTTAEILDLHRKAHAAGLATVAKVEIDAPPQGAGEPFWEPFLLRVTAFAELAARQRAPRMHGPETFGISIEAAPKAFVTATEYFRAVAMARIAARGVTLIMAPLASMPTMCPKSGLGTHSDQHPAEKFAALALHFGAADLGPIDVARLSPVDVMKQIRSAGFTPYLRDVKAGIHRVDGGLADELGKIRHVPATSASC